MTYAWLISRSSGRQKAHTHTRTQLWHTRLMQATHTLPAPTAGRQGSLHSSGKMLPSPRHNMPPSNMDPKNATIHSRPNTGATSLAPTQAQHQPRMLVIPRCCCRALRRPHPYVTVLGSSSSLVLALYCTMPLSQCHHTHPHSAPPRTPASHQPHLTTRPPAQEPRQALQAPFWHGICTSTRRLHFTAAQRLVSTSHLPSSPPTFLNHQTTSHCSATRRHPSCSHKLMRQLPAPRLG